MEETSQQSSQMQPHTSLFKERKIVLSLLGLLLVLLIVIGFIIFKKNSVNTLPSSEQATNDTPKPDDALAKVGNEYIYKKDLDTELTNFPGATDEETKKRLLQKLVKDSIILQAGQQDKLITLDPTVYNSEEKNYMKRIADVKEVEKKVESNMDHISGNMVSVWFNNQLPAKIGIEKGREEALKRITALQKRVANKEITIQEAGNIVKTDSSYADLDIGHGNNALVQFTYPKGEQITIDPGFDSILWNTKEGAVTPVYLGKTLNTDGKEVDAYYIFGQVSKKVDNNNTLDFDKWYESNKEKYEITYY